MTDVLTQTLGDLKDAGINGWRAGAFTITRETLKGKAAVWALLQEAPDAWVECTGCVLWREEGSAWCKLGPKAQTVQPDPGAPAHIPLRAEAKISAMQSIAIAHQHGEDWRLTRLIEGAEDPCLQRTETHIAVIRNKKLKYNLYWDVKAGRPIASAFKGFGEHTP